MLNSWPFLSRIHLKCVGVYSVDLEAGGFDVF